ncbi:bifunctional tRNA (5-methylaminomethyl-2-thiouridine)(34)-methyltransferase MnmD/FAD-dependent 5-carboxymethylaminomethyl-2-thiouridine(34) oxidoreductase MnmC [Hahella ganghwensis]|uniref:bifunctional tRNA (5-methylaminomethyl-2-thiouridine)(34)-methyltransferase MnmD/FAD-dependent 5-carboxymethylaminomethyl-2-thiouridine(34) oxidoreductase MnmC n=1 Tax=Hahella ganghwensis TaxID=286420 RepID=UPI0003622F33|nr:bifunctional tRNA (5-methylaminomethyl-2-thiouridine)(34)-methyltransferase MnmD/FAD-dependent 5-carboxymethylaminomethyl-2-thiouridine(34) oxidoreductase MnmC [Hahella ganghwensis]
MKPPGIKEASIDWSDDSTPVSDQYQDVYFSRLNGKAETEHVFINGNRLRERYQSLPPGSRFVIAETGFGSGLNFLVAWQIWAEVAPKDASLHFVSVEKFPLKLADMIRSHEVWPDLEDYARQLQCQLPPSVMGTHRCQFEQDRVSLTVYHGDVLKWLKSHNFTADAWFLDGFSPKQNPDMWSDELFAGIAAHSAESTTFATFTAAGFIRRGLAACGFNVSKTEGFGQKRDMTVGHMGAAETAPISRGLATSCRITIIGAGLAGAMTASTLARRGFQVTVLEQHEQPGAGASGNSQGALYIKPAVDWNPHTRIHLAHYLFAQRSFQHILQLPEHLWSACGVIQLAFNSKEAQRQHKFVKKTDYPDNIVYPLTADEASRLANTRLSQGGLHFPNGGWVNPQALCRHLLDHPNINTRFLTHITDYNFLNDQWQILDHNGVLYQADALILTEGHNSNQNPLLQDLPFKSIRGQISYLHTYRESTEKDSPPLSYPLKKVICGDGYALPAVQDKIVFGASFHPNSEATDVTTGDNQENLNKLRQISEELFEAISPVQSDIQGRAAVRCALPDYLPVIGPVIAKSGHSVEGQLPRLFVNTAYGSKGLAIAPLAGEIIADMIEGVPLPIENSLLKRLAPDRFNKGN